MSLLEPITRAALLASLGSGCASAVALGPPAADVAVTRALPVHHAVQDVTVVAAGRTVAMVAHVAVDPAGEVRAHLASEGGFTGADVGVRGAEVVVYARSALLAGAGVERRIAADLRRVFGTRSVFALGGGAAAARSVAGSGSVALLLPDGSWLVADAAEFAPGSDRLRVRLLDARRVPEADVAYEDFDADGVPRAIRLVDLRDGHSVAIDVADVLPRGDDAR
jgi:hypothetical protein